MNEPAAAPAADPAPKRSLLWPILIVSLLLLLIGGGVAVWYLLQPKPTAEELAAAEAAKPPPPPVFIPLDPAFVINLADSDGGRYLQLEVQLMTRDHKVEEAVKQLAPVIRNRLLLLFGQQMSTNLRTRADKERLQAEALAEVQAIIAEATGEPGVEALYFTSFVSQ